MYLNGPLAHFKGPSSFWARIIPDFYLGALRVNALLLIQLGCLSGTGKRICTEYYIYS